MEVRPMKDLVNVLLVTIFLFVRPLKAEQVALPLVLTDGLENDWTVQKDGKLYGPFPYKYFSGGGYSCSIKVDGIQFPPHESATRTAYDNGIEISIGPKAVGSVRVTRKIYLGNGEGNIRFLEVINNPTTTPVSIKVSLQSTCYNEASFKHVWENDYCSVVEYSSHPGIEFVYGKGGIKTPKRDKRIPEIIQHTWDAVAIQPQSKVAILHFVAVRPKREQALEFAQAFEVAPACGNIEPSDLACILNYDPRTLGAKSGIEIFRGSDKDVIQLKSGDHLTGIVQNEAVLIQTSYAQLKFPADQIATVVFEGGANNIESIIVLNGDVFSGFILDPEVDIKLDAGPQIRIRKEKISKLGFRVRAAEKEKYPVNHDITLTNGDHFSGKIKNTSLTIGASFGDMTVKIDQIAKIEFISKKGTVSEITLKNGDKVSGFLKDEDIQIDLDFGGGVKVYQDRFEKIIFDFDAVSRITGEAIKEKESQ